MIYDKQVNYIPEYGTCMTLTSSSTDTVDDKISISTNDMSTFCKLPGITVILTTDQNKT